jgi:hypothetical protein
MKITPYMTVFAISRRVDGGSYRNSVKPVTWDDRRPLFRARFFRVNVPEVAQHGYGFVVRLFGVDFGVSFHSRQRER